MKLVLVSLLCTALVLPALADSRVERPPIQSMIPHGRIPSAATQPMTQPLPPITSYTFTPAELETIGLALQEAAQHRMDMVTRLQQQFRAQTQPPQPMPQPELP